MQNKMQYSEARGYNLGIARELGIAPAILYNQLLFWAGRAKGDWFFKSYDELVEELPLSKRSIQTAKETLEGAGYIQTEVRKANGVPMMHWAIMQFATFHVAEIATSMEVAEIATSINNKEHNKEYSIDPDAARQVSNVYRLYLKRFIIPTRLKDKLDDDLADPEALLQMAARRYALSPKRRDAIKRRIADAGYNMVCAAIIGYSNEKWYIGENDRGWVADLAEYICRSYEIVEKGATLYESQKKGKNTNDPWAGV